MFWITCWVSTQNIAISLLSISPKTVFMLLLMRNILYEGASYNDHTSTYEKKDDNVAPKGEYTYVWDISWDLGPMNGDSKCLTYAYSSRVDPMRDFNSGLIGAVLVCKQGECE